MNKLKKTNHDIAYSASLPVIGSPRTSRTLAYASSTTFEPRPQRQSSTQNNVTTIALSDSSWVSEDDRQFQESLSRNDSFPKWVHPRTSIEQYWAARALKAEALLAAQDKHHKELRDVTYTQDDRRIKEISELNQRHHEKHSVMERLVMILIASIVSLVALVIYLASHYTRENSLKKSRWSIPSHFTIPILSPFTSVVEHETSMLGTKVISVMVIVFACFGYFAFRHWLSRTSR